MIDPSTTLAPERAEDAARAPADEDRAPWILGWLAFAPIVVLAAVRGLWAPDEPRYAEVAREAWSKDLLVMHLNGELYPDKPPLVYWLAGLFGKLFAWNELALRVPSLVATLATAWIAAQLARRLFGELEARWTPLFVLATPMVLEIGGRLQLDPVLAALCLASVELATRPDRERRHVVLAGLCAGLGALAKGPVAWLHVGVGILALRRWGPRAPERADARRELGVLVALAIVPVATWALAASLKEGSWTYAKALFFGQHLGRVIEGTQHKGPPWEHLLHFPLYFLPWTPLLVVALARAWRARRSEEPRDRALVALAAWFGLVFVVFSAMPPKRDLYLLPIYPVAAIACARVVASEIRARAKSTRIFALPAAIWCIVGLLGIAAEVAISTYGDVLDGWLARRPDMEEVRAACRTLASSGIGFGYVFHILFLGGAVAFVLARKGARGPALALGTAFAAAALGAALGPVRIVDGMKSSRSLAEWLAARPERPTEIPCVAVQPEGYRFYGRVPTVKVAPSELDVAIAREGKELLALITEKEYARLPETTRARLRVLESRSVGSRDVLVLGATPPGR